jgi:hypothetical protein
MFKDIDVSQDFMKSFKEQRHATQIERNLHVYVLSQSWWPTYLEKQVILPESMVNALESFKEFWLKKQSGRKLMWRHSLGHCILSADFPKVLFPLDHFFLMAGEKRIERQFIPGGCSPPLQFWRWSLVLFHPKNHRLGYHLVHSPRLTLVYRR